MFVSICQFLLRRFWRVMWRAQPPLHVAADTLPLMHLLNVTMPTTAPEWYLTQTLLIVKGFNIPYPFFSLSVICLPKNPSLPGTWESRQYLWVPLPLHLSHAAPRDPSGLLIPSLRNSMLWIKSLNWVLSAWSLTRYRLICTLLCPWLLDQNHPIIFWMWKIRSQILSNKIA